MAQNWFTKLFLKDITVSSATRISQVYTSNLNKIDAYVKEGYAGSAGVYAIVNLLSRKFASIPFYVYDVKDIKALKKYKHLSGALMRSPTAHNIKIVSEARNKAMDLYTDTDDISRLLQKPNQYQGIYDLLEQFTAWREIGGMTCLWGQPQSQSRKQPVELHVLPASQVSIKSGKGVNEASAYWLQSMPSQDYPADEVLKWIYWSPYFDPHARTHMYGLSPIKAAAMNVDAFNNADRAANAMFENRGADGFMFGKGMTVPKDKVDMLQAMLDERHNGWENRGKVTAFGSEISYTQVGLNATDLQLLEAKQYTFEMLCNVWNVPPQCFADDKGSTFNNKSGAMTQLVSNNIIPKWCSFRDMLNAWILPKFGAEGTKFIDFDVSELPEMQKDIVPMLTALQGVDYLTRNEKRAMLEYDNRPEKEMDKIMVSPNQVPIEESGLEPEEDTGGGFV